MDFQTEPHFSNTSVQNLINLVSQKSKQTSEKKNQPLWVATNCKKIVDELNDALVTWIQVNEFSRLCEGGFKVLTVQFYLDSITSRYALTLSLRLELEEIFSLKSVHELSVPLETLVVAAELFDLCLWRPS